MRRAIAVRAAKQFAPRMFIGAAFPAEAVREELKLLVPASSLIGRGKISQEQLPTTFTVGATNYSRPARR